MNLFTFLSPKPTLSETEVKTGLKWMILQGATSMGFNSMTSSGILAAFALALGATNVEIGILAAIPFLMQPLQIPAIFLVNRLRKRKLIAVVFWFLAQLMWFPAALIPFYMETPGSGAISMLLVLIGLRNVFGAIFNCAWNPWIRDLIPRPILGSYTARRLAISTVVGIVFGLGAAFFVEYWKGNATGDQVIYGYTFALLAGAVILGMASPVFMALMPEPLMKSAAGDGTSVFKALQEPLRDSNFRRHMLFQMIWNFASNMAIPFFAVNMLQRLGLPLFWVMGFSILSQLANVLFLRVWGPFADKFGSKVVLSLGISLYLVVFLGWIFTTLPDRYFLTIPLLIVLHIFAGIATAAVSFTIGNLNVKLSPEGQSISYLASAALAGNIGAGLGPLVGGVLANFFAERQLMFVLKWFDGPGMVELPTISIAAYDFLFIITFFLGLMTLSILALVREEGEASREEVLDSLRSPIREMSQQLTSVPAMTFLRDIPVANIGKIPLPGLDVALGVTAYQIADTARTLTAANARLKRSRRRLEQSFRNSFSEFWNTGGKSGDSSEITENIVRGVIHGLDKEQSDLETVLSDTIVGILKAASKEDIRLDETIIGVGRGLVRGSFESDHDIEVLFRAVFPVISRIADDIHVSGEYIADMLITGIIEMQKAYPEAFRKQVSDALSNHR